MPRALAEMRRIKAEGGWGVVCTEEVEIHHTTDLAPNIEGRLWDDEDIPALALMADAVHQHGALAGIELAYGGHHASNLYSRSVGFGPRSIGVDGYHPGQTRRRGQRRYSRIFAAGTVPRRCGLGRLASISFTATRGII